MCSTKDKTEYNEEFKEEECLIKDSDKKINILKHSQKDNNGAQVKSSITVQRSNTTRDNQSSTFNIRDESCADK